MDKTQTVEEFWNSGKLNTESNVQFGEGGAGTFSDGKLTTGIKSPFIRKVLDELYEAGAPEEILYSSKPHIGTDRLAIVVKNIRKRIEQLGGEVKLECRLDKLHTANGAVQGVSYICHGKRFDIETDSVIMAIGHSARDTVEMLYNLGVEIIQKPFSVGARIEHPQSLINKAQYGKFAGHPKLGAADYKLACHGLHERGAYTFCMCPGGTVVAAASEKGYISGFEDGTFKPEEPVTREQFVAMILRYTKTSTEKGETFSDVEINRWSAGFVYTAVKLGIISGYQDGTFKPENPVTRAEVARIVNVATGRIPDKAVIDVMICPYSDLPKSHWAYYELMYASTYVQKD